MRRVLLLLVSSLVLSLASGVSADGRVFESRVKAFELDPGARAGAPSLASAGVRLGNPSASTTIAYGSPLASRGAAVGNGLVSTLSARAVQLVRSGGLVGRNATNIRTIGTGRLQGFTATDTNLAGGADAAGSLFRALAGRAPTGAADRVVLEGLEVGFRAAGRSGHPKMEIVNTAAQTLEKITFLPLGVCS